MLQVIHTDVSTLGQVDQDALRIWIGVGDAYAMRACMREVVGEDTKESIASSEGRMLAALVLHAEAG